MMELSERVMRALRPMNTIEVAPEDALRAKPVAQDARQESGSQPNPQPQGKPSEYVKDAEQLRKQPAYASERESISKSFYVEDRNGERYYFQDYKRNNLAMRATETAVRSKRQDLNTVRAMLDIAQARGWQSVEIRGSAEFKREAWIEAAARGVEARGYKPTDPDQQEADRRRRERGPSNEVGVPTSPASPATAKEDSRKKFETAPRAVEPNPRTGLASDRQQADRTRDALEPATAGSVPISARAPIKAKNTKPNELGKNTNEKIPGEPNIASKRKTVREAQKELSPDGRMVLAALSEKIDRQMHRNSAEIKAELKAFIATKLVKKERAEGPIVLSDMQKRAASRAEPEPPVSPTAPTAHPPSRTEPEAPQRTLGR